MIYWFVYHTANYIIEHSEKTRAQSVELMVKLMEEGLIKSRDFVKGWVVKLSSWIRKTVLWRYVHLMPRVRTVGNLGQNFQVLEVKTELLW